MTSFVSTSIFRFLFPWLLLFMLLIGMNNVILVTSANQGFAGNLPYILFAIAIVLCHTFKQGRMAMVSIAMLIAYSVIQLRLQSSLSTGTTLIELSLLTVLLPVACLFVHAFQDSGVNSKGVAIFTSTLFLFIVWAQLTLNHFNDGGFDNLSESLLFSLPEYSKLPVILILYCIAISGSTSIMVLMNNRSIDVVVYSAILLSSTTFIFFDVQYISSTMFSLSGILVIVYVISASHEMAFNDRLTNIPGRQAFDLDTRLLGRKFTMAMLDIDHFKKFNDTYGHDTGDDVLKLVASRLALTGGNAKVYRYGGEEFTLVFKGKTKKQALPYLEELRADIEEYEMVIRNNDGRPTSDDLGVQKRGRGSNKTKTVTVTVSIGVSDSSVTRKHEEVLKFADQALYKAKKKGRNRVCV
ncbi:GGDEF domain-containing protein [Vibrio sp. 03-59-1]|uniref:GGDEF domain-containing protein n=1 Tax=Vibrio sp. 03-59-1 TaxID=2607607 RepID=UPI001493C098|nr:GGDEF domain-containing protein [Vibrio sp. 03-59-1]NOH83704.1 GGDEF domain-containing protein [Vibrio sp. 03-59-1]